MIAAIRIVEEVVEQPILFGPPQRKVWYRLVEWESDVPVNDTRYTLPEAERAAYELLRPYLRRIIKEKPMKLAIIDLDGVVADATARFAKAEEAKQAFITQKTAEKIERFQRTEIGWSMETVEKQATNLYWQTVFTPELVSLDTLIDGVHQALDMLQRDGYQVILLTSRPESMREATVEWFRGKALMSRSLYMFDLIMKAPAFQYTKTTVWKAGMVQTLEALYGATDLLIVEDEEIHIQEHLKYFSNIQTRLLCKSLSEAVAKLNGTWEEPEAFLPDLPEEE